ncbi:ATP-dependent DNA ligase [Candidatus Woesearchaeota archaeon]|nr:ATP-dependent DNA ligase [Candidatus Woesearchaeota archaeon]
MKYSKLVEVYKAVESTSKRLEKTKILADFLKIVHENELETILLLLQGKVFPEWDKRKLGVAAKLVIKSISLTGGKKPSDVEKKWKTIGDLGEVSKDLVGRKSQATLFSADLTVEKVYKNMVKISSVEGHGSVDTKVKLIAELLSNASPDEAIYIVRTVLEDLRVGIAEGTLRDAITWAFLIKEYEIASKGKVMSWKGPEGSYNEYKEEFELVENAFNKTNDFGIVAVAAKKGTSRLKKTGMQVGKPIQVMLGPKERNIKNAFERVGRPAALEYKYDGFRIQTHKDGGKILLFTRRLEEVTAQFPELVKRIKKFVKGDSYIIDSEVVGYNPNTGNYMPFQNISQRIRRKYDIEKLAEQLPVEMNIFDVLYYEGKEYINEPFWKRREKLKKIVTEEPLQVKLADQLITGNDKEADHFYQQSLKAGNEGLMFKKLDAPYRPGKRVGNMVKMKPVMETLDLVVVGAEWGTGKRSGWLTSFTLGCESDGEVLEIGKVGTGLKELETEGEVTFNELTELLKPLIVKEKGKLVEVKPKIVLEIAYEEIQKSPTYSSGYALRFPRVLKIRYDRGLIDCSTLDEVQDLFYGQNK